MQRELDEIKGEMESAVSNIVENVTEDVEETLEMDRLKDNLIIRGMPETDAEQDVNAVAEMLTNAMHMDSARNVENTERIGKFVEGEPRPLGV